jgi:hypothetical protein
MGAAISQRTCPGAAAGCGGRPPSRARGPACRARRPSREPLARRERAVRVRPAGRTPPRSRACPTRGSGRRRCRCPPERAAMSAEDLAGAAAGRPSGGQGGDGVERHASSAGASVIPQFVQARPAPRKGLRAGRPAGRPPAAGDLRRGNHLGQGVRSRAAGRCPRPARGSRSRCRTCRSPRRARCRSGRR